MTAKKVVRLRPSFPSGATDEGGVDLGRVAEASPAVEDDVVQSGTVLDTLPLEHFEKLIAKGRLAGGLTQHDVVEVLRSVELSADIISGVVDRIRAAGIEFTYDSGETAILPMTPINVVVEPLPRLVAIPTEPTKVIKTPAKRSRAPRTTSTGFSDSDSFRGSAADPVTRRSYRLPCCA